MILDLQNCRLMGTPFLCVKEIHNAILPMITVASAGAYLLSTPVELGPNAKSVSESLRQIFRPVRPKPRHVEGVHGSYALMPQNLVVLRRTSMAWAKVSWEAL